MSLKITVVTEGNGIVRHLYIKGGTKMTHINSYMVEVNHLFSKYAIETTPYRKRELWSIIQKTLQFNKKLIWKEPLENVFLVRTPEELLEIFKLRSKVYEELGYSKEFPDSIEGINFDNYDKHSAVFYTKSNGHITGTCRVIFDNHQKLPLEKNCSLEHLKTNNQPLVELSRLMIEQEVKGLGQEPKLLTKAVYLMMKQNAISTLVSVMIPEHFEKFYCRFGGFRIEKKLEYYSSLQQPFVITSWNIEEVSSFFKKVFLTP
jgi:predicted GNAT family N-acyltransferase